MRNTGPQENYPVNTIVYTFHNAKPHHLHHNRIAHGTTPFDGSPQQAEPTYIINSPRARSAPPHRTGGTYSGLLPLALRAAAFAAFGFRILRIREPWDALDHHPPNMKGPPERETLSCLVEAAGLEPASENHQPMALHV